MKLVSKILSRSLLGIIILTQASANIEYIGMPKLRIETGHHLAVINEMSSLSDGRYVTVSDDKTARIWSGNGNLDQILRIPVNKENDGAIYAVATSRKRIILAANKHDQDRVSVLYVFEKSNKNTFSLADHIDVRVNVVTKMAFDRTGNRLTFATAEKGLFIYDFKKKKAVFKDSSYKTLISDIKFNRSNKMTIASHDGTVCLYSRNYRNKKCTEFGGIIPHHLAFHPKLPLLAIGTLDKIHPTVYILSSEDLLIEDEFTGESTVDTRNQGALSSVAWSQDGKRLYAGGNYLANGYFSVRRWLLENIDDTRDIKVSREPIRNLTMLRRNRIAWSSNAIEMGQITSKDYVINKKRPKHIDFYHAWERGFSVSPDGKSVIFPTKRSGSEWMQFDLHRYHGNNVFKTTKQPDDFHKPQHKNSAIAIRNWIDSNSAYANGNSIPLKDGEKIYAVDVGAKDTSYALGSNFFIRMFDENGLKWKKSIDGLAVYSVAMPPKSNFVIGAFSDGSIRWFTKNDGREIMALMSMKEGEQWIVWTPDGYFFHANDAAGASARLINYQIDKGDKQNPSLSSTNKMARMLYDDEVVENKFYEAAISNIQDSKTDITQAKLSKQTAQKPMKIVQKIQQLKKSKLPIPKKAPKKGDLYILSVGVSDYKQIVNPLQYPAKDAQDIANRFTQEKALYNNIYTTLLTNQNARNQDIYEALQDIAQKATLNDTVIIFFAGHGVDVNGQYYFASYEFEKGQKDMVSAYYATPRSRKISVTTDMIKKGGFSQSMLAGALNNIKSKRVIGLFDTCEAVSFGRPGASRIANKMGSSTNKYFLIAAGDGGTNDFKADDKDKTENNGLFTASILRALRNESLYHDKADMDNDGHINMFELDYITKDDVYGASDGRQSTGRYFSAGANFNLARVR